MKKTCEHNQKTQKMFAAKNNRAGERERQTHEDDLQALSTSSEAGSFGPIGFLRRL